MDRCPIRASAVDTESTSRLPIKTLHAAASLVAAVAFGLSLVAVVEARDFREHPRGQMYRAPAAEVRAARQAERAQQRAVNRAAQQRERGAEQREAQAAPVPEPAARPAELPPASAPGRMSPDERRALRQQINDAGRKVYQPPPRP